MSDTPKPPSIPAQEPAGAPPALPDIDQLLKQISTSGSYDAARYSRELLEACTQIPTPARKSRDIVTGNLISSGSYLKIKNVKLTGLGNLAETPAGEKIFVVEEEKPSPAKDTPRPSP